MKTLELDISFSRDYHMRHFGLSYESSYFDDVRVRAETDRAAQRALFERFGDVGLGDRDPEAVVRLGYDDTLNVTLMFGGELRMGGGVSWVQPGFLSGEAIGTMECPPVATTWPHTQFIEQHAEAERLYGPGRVRPPVPHGILEAALDLRGEAFLEDLLLHRERAERLLDVLTETVIAVKEFWDVKCFGEVQRGLSLGGCSTTMLSPEIVGRFLVGRYSRIASRFGDAFLCSCGVSTQNLETFATIKGVRYIRVGWGTDLGRTARVLRERHVKAGLDVVRAAALSPDEIEADVRDVLTALRPVDHISLLLIHAGADTPDENIRRIVRAALAFADREGIQFKDTPTLARRRGSSLAGE